MFSVLFPGQGSQSVGMAKDLYNNFDYVKVLFEEAEDTLNLSIKKIIFLIHVWVPRNQKIATKYLKFRFPEVPIPFSSVKFRAGSIFEV